MEAPERRRVAWYGDDMTGSVDVLDALMRGGMSAALFIEEPSQADLDAVGDVEAVGIAGMTRTMSTSQLRRTLGPALRKLAALGTPVVHYKVCSTFDSSPWLGSIGASIELASEVVDTPFVPLLVAAPELGRYTVFGNHFARSGSEPAVYRLDRHPTMQHHPVTPMDEADLRLALGSQTAIPQGFVSALEIGQGAEAAAHALDEQLVMGARAVLFDALDDSHIETIGELLWTRALAAGILAVVGSAGVEHALIAHWAAAGELPERVPTPYFAAAGPLLAVAGSRSPVTEVQIKRAVANGFVEVALPVDELLGGDEPAVQAAMPRVRGALGNGSNVIVHSGDPESGAARSARRLTGEDSRRLGSALGAIAEAALSAGSLPRIAVAGGDTSGDVVRRLGIVSLEAIAPFGPAMPLVRALVPGGVADGVELIFKGGQTGTVDFFTDLLRDQPKLDREWVR